MSEYFVKDLKNTLNFQVKVKMIHLIGLYFKRQKITDNVEKRIKRQKQNYGQEFDWGKYPGKRQQIYGDYGDHINTVIIDHFI